MIVYENKIPIGNIHVHVHVHVCTQIIGYMYMCVHSVTQVQCACTRYKCMWFMHTKLHLFSYLKISPLISIGYLRLLQEMQNQLSSQSDQIDQLVAKIRDHVTANPQSHACQELLEQAQQVNNNKQQTTMQHVNNQSPRMMSC